MIKYLSLDLQGTLSDSEFSDYFWLEIIPKKYSDKFNISIDEAKNILKIKFKEYGVYSKLYYDDKYWSNYLNFNTIEELEKCNIKPKLNEKFIKFIENITIPKIIISTTTQLFIDYELKDKIKIFEHTYSCIDSFDVGGKTKEVFEKICKDLNIKPNEILHIGDNNVMDVENAKLAGVNAILYDGNTDKVIDEIKKILEV